MEQNKALVIGKNYLVRTVTMIYSGKLIAVYPTELVLTKACWIAETDRWMQAVANSSFKEVEPYPPTAEVIIGRGSLLDMVQIKVLPIDQK